MKPSQISRVVQILTTLQAGKIYAVDDLSKMLGTSRRTVFRELKELRAVGVPYHYDVKTGGYTIEPHFFLPPIDLNMQEAPSLLLLVHKASRQNNMEFRVDGLGEITWWVLGYGDQVQVLAPRALRKRVLEIAKNTIKLNEKI